MREDWIEVEIGKIGIVTSGGTPSTSNDDYWNGNIAWVTPADLSKYTEKHISKGRKSITENGLKNSSARLIPKNSVLFSSRAPIGYTVIAANEICTNQGFKNITPYSQIISDYVYYYLKASKQTAELRASGTTFKELSAKSFSELPFPLAPLPIQRAIVSKIEALFSDLDNGIANFKKAQEQLKIYRQAVLKKAFEGGFSITNEELRITDSITNYELRIMNEENQSNHSNQKNQSSDNLPKGWKWVKISEISNVVRGGSPRPAGDPKYYDGDIPFLKVRDITKDIGKYLNTFEYTIKEAGLHKTRQIKPNTLLLSNSGATLGVPKICMIDATMNDGIAAFLDLDERSNLYLYYFWLSKTKELRNINMGAAQPNLNTDIIKNYLVPYCSFEEQNQIVQEIESRLSVCDKMEQSINESIEKAEALRQSILKKAFEGRLLSEVEVEHCKQAADYEPASELLKKIQAEKLAAAQEKKKKPTVKKKSKK